MINKKNHLFFVTIISIVIVFSVAFGSTNPFFCFGITAFADTPTNGTCGENLTWEYDSDSSTLTISGQGKMTEFEYKNYLSGPKAELPWRSYYNTTKELIVSEGVASISRYAFNRFQQLKHVSIADSVETIGMEAFYGCTNLKTAGPIGGGYDYEFGWGSIIPSNAFFGLSELESCVLPNTVNTIGDNTFNGCSSLNNIVFPDSLLQIESSAFNNCSTLTQISIPNGALYIGNSAFAGCTSIDNISLPSSLKAIGSQAFYQTAFYNNPLNWENDVFLYCGNYFIESKDTATSCNIKNGTTIVADGAFSGCERLETIIFPNTLLYIGKSACSNCNKLKSINLPDSLLSIGDSAFANNIWHWGSSVTEVKIPDNCSYIGNGAFCHIDSLKSVVFPSCEFTIGNGAFSDCSALLEATIPENCINILGAPYTGCDKIEFITVSIDNPNYKNDEDGVVWTKDGSKLIEYPSGKRNADYVVPGGTSIIGQYAFSSNGSLNRVTFPLSVKVIEYCAFGGTSGLSSVYYPGTQSEWYEISIESSNTYLVNATKFFEHTHLGEIGTELRNTKNPTCTESGYTGDYCCVDCGAIIEKGTTIAPNGHSCNNWTVIRDSSCSEFGEKAKICTSCGTRYETSSIEKKPHTYVEYIVPATCTEKGSIIHLCSVCGYGYADSLPMINHSFTNYVYNNDATLYRDGTETAKCDNCDATDTRIKPGTKLSDTSVVPLLPDVSMVVISAPTGTKQINWKCRAKLTATATNLPADCHLVWYENGKNICDKADFTTESLTSNHTYTAKIVYKDGTIVSNSEQEKTVTVEVKTDFFSKLTSFFTRLFGNDTVNL